MFLKTNKRYNHWFWNSCFISWLEGASLNLAGYLWRKQYTRNNEKNTNSR